jgi:hypothetical protein
VTWTGRKLLTSAVPNNWYNGNLELMKISVFQSDEGAFIQQNYVDALLIPNESQYLFKDSGTSCISLLPS